MTDLWCFLQQTLAATLAALVLLAVQESKEPPAAKNENLAGQRP